MSDDIIRIRLTAASPEALRAFADETGADLGCRPIARRTAEGFQIDAYLPEDAVRSAQTRGIADVAVEWIENSSEISRQRQEEVARGNRYAARGAVPRGLGRKE
jgi:hypothetical protein